MHPSLFNSEYLLSNENSLNNKTRWCWSWLMMYVKRKIRIGYILKSADVETLFSRRYSENSSHTHTHRHPSTSTHTRAHHCTLKHTHAHQCKPTHTGAHPPSPAHNCAHRHPHTHTGAHPRTSAQAYAHPRTPRHTRAHLRTVDTPHIPADALNLINHLKLHVNGKMAKDR